MLLRQTHVDRVTLITPLEAVVLSCHSGLWVKPQPAQITVSSFHLHLWKFLLHPPAAAN